MARIRSIHPGIWTDEEFASLSMPARVLYFGLLTEADDNGIFEWKPTRLKMRIFPADNVDIEPLLLELLSVDKISKSEIDGKEYGAIRNFRRYQRPKKPNTRFPISEQWRTYVGLTEDSSEPAENQFGTGREIHPQMEEEGGRMERRKIPLTRCRRMLTPLRMASSNSTGVILMPGRRHSAILTSLLSFYRLASGPEGREGTGFTLSKARLRSEIVR